VHYIMSLTRASMPAGPPSRRVRHRLGGAEALELCRDKRLVLVGDSLNRNMWESLACILYAAVPDRSRTRLIDDAGSEYMIFRAIVSACLTAFARPRCLYGSDCLPVYVCIHMISCRLVTVDQPASNPILVHCSVRLGSMKLEIGFNPFRSFSIHFRPKILKTLV
jgi:hypothetical protein